MSESGVYAITNTVTGEQYVGLSDSLTNRQRIHWSALQRGKHHNKRLQTAWDAHGAEAFRFDILESFPYGVNVFEGAQAELEWIERLQPAYNIARARHDPYWANVYHSRRP